MPFPHHCPSCGRETSLTDYRPEPSLCMDCQVALGLRLKSIGATSPDNPAWGLFDGFGMWFLSFIAIQVAGIFGIVFYTFYAGRTGLPIVIGDNPLDNSPLMVILISSTGVAHMVTVLVGYILVTNGRRQSFLKSLGWGWTERFRLREVLLAFLALFVLNVVVSLTYEHFFGKPEDTPFDKLISSSFNVRLTICLLAVITAPFVEELVYRGIFYPAAARKFGRPAAIVITSALFLLVHVDQYAGTPTTMIPLGALSVVLTAFRAYSGSLLPSFALHLLFNLVQATLIMALK